MLQIPLDTFNMLSLLVLTGILAAGLLVINLYGRMEEKRLRRKLDKHPKTYYIGKSKKATQKELDRLLEMDDTERFYH